MDLPREDSLRWLVSRYAHLRHAHGEAIGDPELLEPSGRHFPDTFTHDAPSVGRLLTRMIGYAPLSEDIEVGLRFVEPDGETGGGCSSGSCGTGAGSGGGKAPSDRVLETDNAYIAEIPVGDVGHPAMLTTTLARAVGSLVLFEASEEIADGELGALSEVAASVSGFGVLLACGAHVYGKSCGGVRMHQHTHLSVEEHGVLLALFVAVHALRPSAARAHLEATQREAFDEAWAWVQSNEKLVDSLREHPELLEDGVFPIDPVRGLLGRIFARRSPTTPSPPPPHTGVTRRQRTPEEERRLAEAKALVEEALRGG